MFSKGNRFIETKPSEVPGPNSYNVRDPQYDAYKRVAFLEKEHRFSKDKPSDVPGPGTYETGGKVMESRPAGSRVASGDRYAVLQRKLDDLERVHDESKKAHIAEIERLKHDLSRAQRTNVEQGEQLTKLKKQKDVCDARIQDLKKTELASQSELKELRAKLRVSEHERTQLTSKQSDSDEAKKALQALEARRKEEAHDKDRRISDLEKELSGAKKRVEALETRLHQTKAEIDSDLQQERHSRLTLASQLRQTKDDSENAKSALQALREQTANSEEALLEQLNQHKRMLSRVADEYARLASSTLSLAAHEQVKREAISLRLRVNRLERKLANSESQVIELAQLIRHTNEDNAFLLSRLTEVEHDLSFYIQELATSADDKRENEDWEREVDVLAHDVRVEFLESRAYIHQVLQFDAEIWSTLESLRSGNLLLHASCLIKHVDSARHDVETQTKHLASTEKQNSELLRQVSTARSEQERLKQELASVSQSLVEARAGHESLKQLVETEKQKAKSEMAKLEQTVKREREARDRAVADMQKSKAAAEGLTNEINQLSADLADAERYERAYNNLVDQVDALVRKNALAEDEAQKLSNFNAEILGHHNPAQRIQYVDRIRRELHETKQELLMMTKERDAISSENDTLLHELQAYKSVNVAPDLKPRTTLTRVGRQPLANQSLNVRPTTLQGASRSGVGSRKDLETMPEVEYKEGDMTIDELI